MTPRNWAYFSKKYRKKLLYGIAKSTMKEKKVVKHSQRCLLEWPATIESKILWNCMRFRKIYWSFLKILFFASYIRNHWYQNFMSIVRQLIINICRRKQDFNFIDNNRINEMLWKSFNYKPHWPLRQWGFWQRLSFSWTTLRGKHWRHPIAVMGVVDTFGPRPPAILLELCCSMLWYSSVLF